MNRYLRIVQSIDDTRGDSVILGTLYSLVTSRILGVDVSLTPSTATICSCLCDILIPLIHETKDIGYTRHTLTRVV